jgi:hypothetical protein
MNQLTFENPVFACYALAAALMIVKMMSQGWITVFRMAKINAGFRLSASSVSGPRRLVYIREFRTFLSGKPSKVFVVSRG